METFDKFWYLLPKKDADIYFELRNYLESPGCETDIARLFKTSTHRYILLNLIEYPYPMCQIVRCFPSSIYMQLYYEALKHFIDFSTDQLLANKFNLYSFLINIHMSDKWLEKCELHIFNEIFQRTDADEYWELPLVLLSSKSMPLIEAFNTYLNHSYETKPFQKRNAFFITTNRKSHFFESLIENGYAITEPHFMNGASRLIKLAMLVSNKPTRTNNDFNFYEEVWKQFEQIDATSLSGNQKIFYFELGRMLSLHHFVRSNRRYEYLSDSMAIKVLASKYNILDFFVKFNEGSMIINTNDYHFVRRQLVENKIFNQTINPNIKKDTAKPSEVNIYDQFYTIYLMIEVLLVRPMTRNYEDIIRTKSAEIKRIVDNIDDPHDYVEAIEFLFMLLFLRYEHVKSRFFSNGKLDSTSATTSVTYESDSTVESNGTLSLRKARLQTNLKSGFACTFTVLKYMLSALNSSMVSRKIHELNDESLQQRYTRISNAIQDAKWRHQLVDLYYTATNCIRASSDLKIMLTSRSKQVYSKVFSSSDEDDAGNTLTVPKRHSVIRRKPRRRNPTKKAVQNENTESFAHSTEIENKTNTSFNSSNVSMIRHGNQRDRRKFMSKMLGQLTDMVAISVVRGDLTDAKHIIEKFDLFDSSIAREVKLLEHFNSTKTKLKDIFQIESNPSENNERAIVNEIEDFLAKHPLDVPDDIETLFDRFSSNYPYLELYKGLSLQGTIVLDYALSLPSSVDISPIVIDMLTKLWDKEEKIDLWHDRIGYYGFVRHIQSTLSLYNASRNQSIGIKDLLANQLYIFNESEIMRKLQKEDTYRKQQQIPLHTLNARAGLIEHIMNFEMYSQKNENLLQHVFSYSMNMNRLIHFKNPTDVDRTCLQEILEIDLFSLIGQIMFNESANVTLKDIESIVCNLNTNLLHVITKNTCPTISICDKFSSNPFDDLNEIIQLLTKENDSNPEICDFERNNDFNIATSKPFKIKRLDILDYVRQHNELIAHLLARIHGIEHYFDSDDPIKSDLNCKLLDNLMQLEEVSIGTESSNGNDRMTTALNFDSFDLNAARELVIQRKYRSALRMFQFCQERHLNRFKALIEHIQDELITNILDENNNDNNENDEELSTYSLIEHIKDLKVMSTTLLKYINRISNDQLALHLIRTILLHDKIDDLPNDDVEQWRKYLADVSLYASIGRATTITDLLPHDTWTKIMEMSRMAPERLLHSLIERNQFELCYKWIQTISLQTTVIKSQFIDLFMNKIQENRNTDNEHFIEVCKQLLKLIAKQTDSNLLLNLKNRLLLEYLVDFLIENSKDENPMYNNYKITLSIFDVIDPKEVDTLWDLVEMPLLIVEQYIINSKFETLSKILQVIRPQIKNNECAICMSSTISDSDHSKLNEEIVESGASNRNIHVNYKDHATSIQCIDHILRIYAGKALDFHIGTTSSVVGTSMLNRAASLESIGGSFIMPREAPEKSQWIKDIEAKHCMCCKRSIFTMLTRRHHCRRCGRVVCHSCSHKRMLIPRIYDNVMVRVCDDCFKQTNDAQNTVRNHVSQVTPVSSSATSISELLEANQQPISSRSGWIYRFNGTFKHDSLLRDEFSFEYAPSASLCLTLISMHTPGQHCSDYLLNYCKQFEALLKPLKPGHANPEVDYAFVTRILYCLSFAAKVHGDTSECVNVRDHAEIINSIVRSGCESLLPMESINMKSLRTLRDNLVVAEKFGLAIEISLKSGLQKTGIMAAWGIACIKAGCFETAREKFVHCLIRTTCDEDCRQILHFLTTDDQTVKNQGKIFNFKSTSRSPKIQPLLFEILAILETTCHPVNSNVLQRASSISQSNRSLLSIKLGKKEKFPVNEPAVNILHTLSNLKQISQGKYTVKTHRTLGLTGIENMNSLFASDSEQHGLHSRFYTESIYYLVRYGRHIDILRFLIKYRQVSKALRYSLFLLIPTDQFIQTIIMPYLKSGRLNVIIQQMIDMDATLMIWKDYIIQICLMLEKRNLLNSLYQVQLLLKDTIRASMTCVRFYAMGCVTYQDLRNNAHHLLNAQQHLKSELELCQWEEIKTQTKRTEENQSFVMKMDPKSLNQHINTIWRQIDASKFLASCEENSRETVTLLPKISLLPCTRIPTLFENTQDKIMLCALILICGANVEEGFGLAYRIIQDMGLNSDKIYAIATKYFALNNQLHDVEKLVSCIKSNSSQLETKLCDEIISLAVQSALSNHSSVQRTKATIENLIHLIHDVSMQIDCHILSGQLKAAYLLAVQHKRVSDIRRILRYAEKTNQTQIKKLCEKKLQSIDAQSGHSSEH